MIDLIQDVFGLPLEHYIIRGEYIPLNSREAHEGKNRNETKTRHSLKVRSYALHASMHRNIEWSYQYVE